MDEPRSSRRASMSAPVAEGDMLAGKYRVDRVLGAGGMGIVVAATHVDLKQKVALKFLLPRAMANPQNVERFLREGRTVANLKSEHITRVIDVGRMTNSAPYIVMEYLEGADLGATIRSRGQIPLTEAISYVLQGSEAVAEAHAANLVHRDLKPENLFLTRSVHGAPLIKVLDFGISKSLDEEDMSLTQTSSMIGSPAYMSPEQMRSSKSVDRRADIWSLGVILYELVTGKLPYRAETLADLAFKLAQQPPQNPKAYRPDLPDAMCDIILKCLAREKDKRYSTLGDLACDLELFAAPPDREIVRKIQAIQAGGLPQLDLTTSMDGAAQSDTAGEWGPTQYPDGSVPNIPVRDTAGAWGTTQHPAETPPAHPPAPPKAKRAVWPFAVGGAAVVLVLGGVGVGVKTMRARAAPPTAETPLAETAKAAERAPSASSPQPTAETKLSVSTASATPAASVAEKPSKAGAGATTKAHAAGKGPQPTATPSAATPAAAQTATSSNGFINVRE